MKRRVDSDTENSSDFLIAQAGYSGGSRVGGWNRLELVNERQAGASVE